MDVGLRTPLLDSFRRGDAPREVRLLAATGALAPRSIEQLAILSLLTRDPDADIRAAADKTLARIPADRIAATIGRADAPTELREFFAQRQIQPGGAPASSDESPLVDEDSTDYGRESVTDDEKASLLERLAAMSVPDKVKAAIKGTREMRAVLVRDSNKIVALAVLSSPKLTETEVESIARMGSVGEDVLRTIGNTRAWVKNYGVVSALLKNAKTPLAVSLSLLGRVTDRDLKALSIDRNIPDPLRVAAGRRLSQT